MANAKAGDALKYSESILVCDWDIKLMVKNANKKPTIIEPVSPINILFLEEKLNFRNANKAPISATDIVAKLKAPEL